MRFSDRSRFRIRTSGTCRALPCSRAGPCLRCCAGCACAFARAAAVRVATRSSSAIISSTSARSKPWVMNTILLRWSASGQRSSHDRLCNRCCAPWITAGRSGSSATLTMPFTRKRLGPRFCCSASSRSRSASRAIGCLAHETERGDVAVVQMMVIVIVRDRGRDHARVRRLFIGGGIEPGARIGLGVVRIEAVGAQQRADRQRPDRRCVKSSPPD
jgi:hypothetical protein